MSAEKFVGEVLGTMILILLGDGVVAGVLLDKSKAFAGGWIVITMAWGMAVFSGIAVAGTFTGAHMNPGGDARGLPRRPIKSTAPSASTSCLATGPASLSAP